MELLGQKIKLGLAV